MIQRVKNIDVKFKKYRINGEYIYIPKKEENKIAWGELTKSKNELLIRNDRIYEDYLSRI
jgi:hypothetical protein